MSENERRRKAEACRMPGHAAASPRGSFLWGLEGCRRALRRWATSPAVYPPPVGYAGGATLGVQPPAGLLLAVSLPLSARSGSSGQVCSEI